MFPRALLNAAGASAWGYGLVEGCVAGGCAAGGCAGGVVAVVPVVTWPDVPVLDAVVFILSDRLANQMMRPRITSAPIMMPIHVLELRRGVVAVEARSS